MRRIAGRRSGSTHGDAGRLTLPAFPSPSSAHELARVLPLRRGEFVLRFVARAGR